MSGASGKQEGWRAGALLLPAFVGLGAFVVGPVLVSAFAIAQRRVAVGIAGTGTGTGAGA